MSTRALLKFTTTKEVATNYSLFMSGGPAQWLPFHAMKGLCAGFDCGPVIVQRGTICSSCEQIQCRRGRLVRADPGSRCCKQYRHSSEQNPEQRMLYTCKTLISK
jgi:hypothetical protein